MCWRSHCVCVCMVHEFLTSINVFYILPQRSVWRNIACMFINRTLYSSYWVPSQLQNGTHNFGQWVYIANLYNTRFPWDIYPLSFPVGYIDTRFPVEYAGSYLYTSAWDIHVCNIICVPKEAEWYTHTFCCGVSFGRIHFVMLTSLTTVTLHKLCSVHTLPLCNCKDSKSMIIASIYYPS